MWGEMMKLHPTIRKFPELLVVPLMAATLLIVVDLPKLDLWLSTLLYNESAGRWSLASLSLFDYSNRYFERTFVVAGALASLVCIAVYYVVRCSSHWRRVGIFLLLSLAIGPGLIVNGVFKNAWGRPRPVDTVQFGGTQEFRRITNPGIGGAPELGGAGRSFPSGHAAAAFWSTSLFFVARYLFPQRSLVVLAATVALGLLVGAGRVVAGRHYPSDVLWAGLLVFSVNGLIAYLWLRLPRHPLSHRAGS
jgi:membrane-associated PAP2 superfamily phosphatase